MIQPCMYWDDTVRENAGGVYRYQFLLARYVNDLGGDPDYFVSGAGAPGNCCIS